MNSFAIVLSGCGYLDGSEIHEAVATLLAVERLGIPWSAYAPDGPQASVVDHKSKTPSHEKRNILAESARIVRGAVEPTSSVDMHKHAAILLPGGFGAATNLCNFATAGADCSVRPELTAALRDAHRMGKPIGAVCIAPALVAAAFRGTSVKPLLTIGNDPGTARALEAMGARHKECGVRDCVVDEANRIVSTPAYMYPTKVSELAEGVAKMVTEVARLAGVKTHSAVKK
jgi:enhancing lycopene biosynthesis protein 2